MIRLLCAIVFISATLAAETINKVRLSAQTVILPRILILQKDGAPNNKNYKIAIVHNGEEALAKDTSKKIGNIIKQEEKDASYSTEIFHYNDNPAEASKWDFDAIFLMCPDGDIKNTKTWIAEANSQGVVSFAYSSRALALGATISLDYQDKALVYINFDASVKNRIRLNEATLSIATPFTAKN